MLNTTDELARGSRLSRNTVLNLVGQCAPLLVAIFAIPLLIRGLGTDRFGVLTLAWVVIGYFSLFDLGQQDTNFLDTVAREAAPEGFDIIIDDASHIGDISKITFWHLFDNHLKPGGIYVIEDWRTGYWDKWIDGARYKKTKESKIIRPFIHGFVGKCLNFTETNLKGGRIKRTIVSCFGRIKRVTYKYHFPSHNFGMVGFVKELVDELGV